MHDSLRPVVLVLLSLGLLVACGQKGPLFLPADPDEIRSTVPQPSTEQNDESEDDEDEVPRTN